MQDLSVETMIAVFEETFGRGFFWALVAVAVTVSLGYLYVLVRDRHVGWRKFLVAQLFMPVGAVGAVWVVMAVTHSRLSDIGGPIDVVILLGIAALGAGGIAIFIYTFHALFFTDRATRRGGTG